MLAVDQGMNRYCGEIIHDVIEYLCVVRKCSYFMYETYYLAWGFKVSSRSSAVCENELKSKRGL